MSNPMGMDDFKYFLHLVLKMMAEENEKKKKKENTENNKENIPPNESEPIIIGKIFIDELLHSEESIIKSSIENFDILLQSRIQRILQKALKLILNGCSIKKLYSIVDECECSQYSKDLLKSKLRIFNCDYNDDNCIIDFNIPNKYD